jgi:hypothetical protein
MHMQHVQTGAFAIMLVYLSAEKLRGKADGLDRYRS